MNQDWFEMKDIRRRNFSRSVWIPLRAIFNKEKTGTFGYEGYKEDFFGSGSIAVPTNNLLCKFMGTELILSPAGVTFCRGVQSPDHESLEAVKELDWMDIVISHHHFGYVQDKAYVPADIYRDHREFDSVHLVLDQMSHDDGPHIWHLNQDLILTLGLKQEGDSWICPRDGYTEVARLKVTESNKPTLLEIKAEYLKDYLCARKMALYMTHFFSRDLITDDASYIDWEGGSESERNVSDKWEGRVIPIHEGGEPFGGKVAMMHVARTDVEETDDVPAISGLPSDENTKSESWERGFQDRKLYRILGELWRNEIIMPGKRSPKVRGDEIPSTIYFILDADGSKVCGQDLIGARKWLWFKPEVIMALCNRRGGALSFYTQQTGSVTCLSGYGVHFGVNELGFINVYAKDIGQLPEWQQQIWAGHNITPEGGVSSELLASQVKAEPADTLAPEEFLPKAIQEVNELSQDKLGIKLFRDHEAIPELLSKLIGLERLIKPPFMLWLKIWRG